MSGEVLVEREGNIAWMVFDHQQRRNAMTYDMWTSIPPICEELSADDDVRVIGLRGAGDTAFVAGADISQFESNHGRPNSPNYDNATGRAFAAITAIPKPVVALIHGFCIGGGLAIAASADLRYVAEDAQFGLPPARLGIGYSAAGVGVLVDLLGPSVTKELIFTANWFDASTALRWGLVNQVLKKADLDSYVNEQLETIASRAPLSQTAAKLAVADHLLPESQRQPDQVNEAIGNCFRSSDYAEGIAAFMNKRRPDFQGR